jgi:hypothetical protein
MTPKQAKRRFRSLRYSKRLQASTRQRRAELMIFVWERGGQAVIDGCRVTLNDGQLSWERLPTSQGEQLKLFQSETERKKERA